MPWQFFNVNSRPRPGLVVVYFIGSGFNGRSQTLLQAAIICGTLCRLACLERSNRVRWKSVLKVELQIFSSAAFFILHGKLFFFKTYTLTYYIVFPFTRLSACIHKEREKWACRGVDILRQVLVLHDTTLLEILAIMLSTTGTDPARCLVHASTNLASAMVLRVPPGFSHGFESSARDIQTATLQKQAPRFGRKRPQTDDTGNPMDSFLPSRNTITYPTLKGSGGKMRKYF